MNPKGVSVLLAALFAGGCQPVNPSSEATANWELVYEHDESGNTVSGSREALVSAVQSGKQLRIYIGDRSFGHLADAGFLTVFEGEVFAQFSPIESQAPTTDPLQILFREPGIEWRAIIGRNGFFTALMDGSEPNVRTRGAKWFVQN